MNMTESPEEHHGLTSDTLFPFEQKHWRRVMKEVTGKNIDTFSINYTNGDRHVGGCINIKTFIHAAFNSADDWQAL